MEDVIPFINRGVASRQDTAEMYNTCAMDSVLCVFRYIFKNNDEFKKNNGKLNIIAANGIIKRRRS